ncbi:hypothetical protein MPSEU_001094400 [Mayamaea pseudoterrestris]|nr:hypothetical protein MPSEU_001094400 [Mayamaea pseudoterrestris]
MDTETAASETLDAVESLQQISLEETAKESPSRPGNAEASKQEQDDLGSLDKDSDKDTDDDDEMPPLEASVLNNKDSSDSEADNPADPDPPTQEQADEIMVAAISHKEEGNDHFKQGSLELAARSYRKGCQSIKRLLPRNRVQETVDEQIVSLHLALHTNLSMVMFQLKKYKQSIDIAGKALLVQPDHVKALYRRSVAQRAVKDLNAAKTDLLRALQLDAKNAACRKELASLQQEMQALKEQEKRSLAMAFSGKLSNGKGSLYQDKEAEERKKKDLAQKRQMKEQEQYKKRKQEWEDECVKRMAKNEPAISFDEWEKEQKELEKTKREEEEKKRKEDVRKRKEALKAKRAQESTVDDDSDDDELTEKELAMMRGYKITKDGRKTSYFTRELSDDTAKHYHDIAPKRLNSAGNGVTSDATQPLTTTASAPLTNNGTSTSAWNAAGTWEEKDTTTWCSDRLKKRLEATSVSSDKFEIDIVEVKSVTGHGSVAFTAGKKRYIFEYEAELKYEVKLPDNNQIVASGTVCLPDIESTSHDELEVAFGAWTKKPSSEVKGTALNARLRLAEEIRLQVQGWVDDFNAAY